MAITRITGKGASLPQVQKVLDSHARLRTRAKGLSEDAKHSATPAVATLFSQAGAGINGALRVYFPAMAPQATLACGLGGIIAGSMMVDPRLVLVGNGILAPVVADKVFEALQSRKGSMG